ncbi:hypothetical protein HXA35_16815 [Bacillus sp. A301a_S52]|nr:hypothetical protein [Bacillus sp. A301a_S52]
MKYLVQNKIINEEMQLAKKRQKKACFKNKNLYFAITAAALFFIALIAIDFNGFLDDDSSENVSPLVDSPYYNNLNELYNHAQIIVSGTMLNQVKEMDSETEVSYIITELSVSNVYKGDSLVESVFIRQLDPDKVATDTVVIEENKEYLFFLEGDPQGQLFPISEQVFVINDNSVFNNQGDVSFTLDELVGLSK